jgi:hypothetical protein
MSRILGLLAVVLLVLAPLSNRLHFLPLQIGLLLVPLAALLGLIAIIVGLTPKRRSALGIVAGLVPLAFFGVVIVSGHGLPMIHDISTDVADPPVFVTAPTMQRDALNSLDYNPKNTPLQLAAFPDLHGIATQESPAAALEHAKLTAQALGWEIYADDPSAGRIEAVETTRLFGFKDDVVIRVRPRDGGSIVDLRSVSRVGEGDLGANAKRIRRFIAAYTASQHS